ncbi:MAG: 2-amino-4-hydroxy-6-hydroxymethyldihydropteridine diphosphokinase [Blastocatellia bacterium]
MTNGKFSDEVGTAVYIGLGSNIGDRRANLRAALARLKKLGIEVVRESSIYETEPVGYRDQQWFLNQVIEARFFAGPASDFNPTDLDSTVQAESLLFQLLDIEHEMRRERALANGPRVIDIDLLLFGDMIIGDPNKEVPSPAGRTTQLIVPHPRMHLRRFVVEPLCEIAPELVHPVLKKKCHEILALLEDASRVSRFSDPE